MNRPNLQVQCSPDGDEANVCGDKPDKPDNCPGGQPPSPGKPTGVEAYSNPLEKYSKITFCNIFFNKLTSLDYVINTAKRNSPAYQNDLWNYQNRARVLFHEMTHLNYFVNAPDSSPYVDDVKIKFGPVKGRKNELCYGPEHVKILANYEAVGKGGFYTQRNGTVVLCPLHSIRFYLRRATNVICSGHIRMVCNGKIHRKGSWSVRTI